MLLQAFELTYRTLIAITVMFLLTKMLGKRQLSEISLFGYISGVSIGDIAAFIALENHEYWILGILALILWVGVTVILELSTLKSKNMRNVVDSTRREIIAKGVVLKEALHKERFTIEELLSRLRSKEVYRLSDVESASIEANGEVSIFMKQEYSPLTPSMLGIPVKPEKEPVLLIVDGAVEKSTLRKIGMSEGWLNKQLATVNLKAEDVFIAQLAIGETLSLHTLDQRIVEIKLQSEEVETERAMLEHIKQSLIQTIAFLEQQAQQAKKKQG